MTTATLLHASNPITPTGGEKIAGDTAAGITGGMLSQDIANLFKGTKGADIASATTTDIGAATGVFVHITGTVTITGLGTVAAGAMRLATFDGILILTHNGTSLILPTGANITTAAGDSALFLSEGSGNWRCLGYWRKSGASLAGSGVTSVNSLTGAVVLGGEVIAEPVNALSISSGVVNIDCSLGDYFTLTLSANVTSITFSNLPASGRAQTLMVRIQQNASAAKTVAFPSSFKWAGGTTGVVSTALSAYDNLAITTFDQGTRWEATLAKAFA